jgi:hypothetical protein
MDYRFTVVFTHESGVATEVPGYFAADGNAAETSATSGSTFRAHLAPPLTGTWGVRVEFTTGVDVAVLGGGLPVLGLHGFTGSFNIAASNKQTPDFRAKGMLLPVLGERCIFPLRFLNAYSSRKSRLYRVTNVQT